jgi:hypothetical protein
LISAERRPLRPATINWPRVFVPQSIPKLEPGLLRPASGRRPNGHIIIIIIIVVVVIVVVVVFDGGHGDRGAGLDRAVRSIYRPLFGRRHAFRGASRTVTSAPLAVPYALELGGAGGSQGGRVELIILSAQVCARGSIEPTSTGTDRRRRPPLTRPLPLFNDTAPLGPVAAAHKWAGHFLFLCLVCPARASGNAQSVNLNNVTAGAHNDHHHHHRHHHLGRFDETEPLGSASGGGGGGPQ